MYKNVEYTYVNNAFHNFLEGGFMGYDVMMLHNDSQFGKTHKHILNFETANTLVQEYSVFIHLGNLKVRHCNVLDRELVILQ